MRLLTDALGRGLVRFLTHFVLKVPCDPLENIRKPLVFWCFQGYQRGAFGRNGLILLDLLETSHKCTGKEFDLVFNPFRPEALLWSPWKHQETFGFQMFSGGSKGSLRRKWVNAFRLTWDFSKVHWEGVSARFSRISKFCWTFYWTFKFARRNLLQKRRFYWNFPEIFSEFLKNASKIKNFIIRQLYERHLPFSKFS